MNGERLHTPPFGAQIDAAHEMVVIYCGKRAWKLAKPGADRVASLVFPNNRDPSEFRWPVKDRQVLVIAGDESDSRVDVLVIELLRADADLIHVRYSDERLVHYDPKARRAKST